MWKTEEGSSARLLQLCIFYFLFYVITGVTVRYFQFYPHGPKLSEISYLTYSTIGGTALAVLVILALRWYKFKSAMLTKFIGIKMPKEFYYIIPSGFCTAIVITFTTLMYSIKGISVMVAMVLMRASVIIISRLVDFLQIRQNILHKKVYWEENLGVVFAILAISTKLFWSDLTHMSTGFNFITHPAAMTIFTSYVLAYAFRIYIMNYFKNTRPKNLVYDYKGFFAVEQFSAMTFLILAALGLYFLPIHWGNATAGINEFKHAITSFNNISWLAILGGTAFGAVAFFSVFIFMFKGRTATFAGLVNRLTSLLAGITATILSWIFLSGGFPEIEDWISLSLIVVALIFTAKAERRRVKELARQKSLLA